VTPEQKAAYIQAQAACAMADIAGMQAENTYRENRGETTAYDEASFAEIPNRYGIHHNAVVGFFDD